ncbi:MAG: efflux RND transporter permease subunit, partial [Cyclobacteriaceae bacterium]|nr:efflux RND transporter permease subunit [Cyclobacteriaceae bacterium]
IILVVFLPIITLTGIEGKTFRPMALTVSYAILGAMILSMTYVPVVSSLLMSKNIKSHFTVSDRIMNAIRKMYLPVLERSLKLPKLVLGLSIGLFLSTIVVFSQMGAEFIPTLEEGDLAMQMTIQPGSSLEESIKTSTRAEQILLDKFPEIKHVVSKIGTAEVPTDPMAIEDADIMIVMKEKDEWTSAQTREDLVAMMKQELEVIIGATFEFTQPIQLRFNELMTGAKTDIAIKIFGEDLDELVRLGNNTADIIGKIEGAGDVKVEQTDGLPQLVIKMNRDQLARYHVDVDDVNQAVRMAYAGEVAGVVFEGEKKFDLVIRLLPAYREGLDLSQLFIPLENGNMVPLGDLVTTELVEGPMQISREDAKRRIVIGVNVRNRDVASLVNDIQTQLNSRLALPPGYYITYGGQFENLQAAQQRLIIAVPIALLLIFLFLYTAFRSLKYSALIFTAVPLSAIGGIIALWSRGMPFSISAGVGFIALFGVAVLNGIVLISHLNELRESGEFTLGDLIIRGSLARLRPVLMTAAVAAFGFLPMALSTSAGAEVQKPLATVVVGGLISSTLLTLVVLPVIYLISNRSYSFTVSPKLLVLVIGMLGLSVPSLSQTTLSQPDAIQRALSENLELKQAELSLEQSRLSIRKAYDPGDLSLDYQRGNINSQFVDYWWEANQSLGNPLEVLRAKDVAMASYHAKEAAYLLLKKHVIHEVKQAWNIWYFESKRLGAIEAAIPATETLLQKIQKAVEVGEINFATEKSLTELARTLETMRALALTSYQQSWQELQKTCRLDSLYNPGDLVWIPILTDSLPQLDPLFYNAQEREMETSHSQVRAKKAAYFPTLSAGYFQQEIDGIGGLNGWKIGASIPLWNRPTKVEVQTARIEALKTQQNLQYEIENMENELVNLLRLYRGLTGFMNRSATDFEEDMRKINRSLSEGNISMFEYAQLLQPMVQNQLKAIDLQLLFYQTLYQIEYLSK